MKNILLVEPAFPFPNKSKNKADSIHKNFVPIGLLKFGAMHKANGDKVKLVRGKVSKSEISFKPNTILVTSLFTYWSKHVWNSISHYRKEFPKSEIWVGGIYTTLHWSTKKFQNLLKIYKVKPMKGICNKAEKFLPDYSLISEVDYHATHMMRGCIRKCSFCGTWKIEPERTNKTKAEVLSELTEIGKNKVIFYDNNLLANPNIKDILKSFVDFRVNNKPIIFESQSGFDGRLIEADPKLAKLIKKARFQNVRIAWDNGVSDAKSIKKQINNLVKVGYPPKDISVFMIYNYNIQYNDMLKKLRYCNKWGVQIIDCRYRPLALDSDNYNSHKRNGQPEGSFYIHKVAEWSDKKIRDFRKKVRQHNIEIRYAKDKGLRYDRNMEKWSAIHNTYKFFNLGRPPKLEKIEKSKVLSKRVKLLNKLKNQRIREKLGRIDFSNYSMKNLDQKIKINLK